MQKIPTLFERNWDGDRLVRDEITPGCEWVVAGEGYATRKFDGACCAWDGARLLKRYELKRGRSAPPGFIACAAPDPVTGDEPGWLLVGDGPEDQYHREALARVDYSLLPPGTYELCGPKIQKNPERFAVHMLVGHCSTSYPAFPRTFDEIREALRSMDVEGIVWRRYHRGGHWDLAKIKCRDFGILRGSASPLPEASKVGGGR